MALTEEQIAELTKKAHAYDSEQGRLKKAQEDLEKALAEKTALAQALAQHQADGGASEPQVDTLKSVIGAEAFSAMQAMLASVVKKELSPVQQILSGQQAERDNAAKMRAFLSAMETDLSSRGLGGMTHRLYSGDLSNRWAAFKESHPSVGKAEAEQDSAVVLDMLNIFINQNREAVAGAFAPSAVSGGVQAVQPEYTDADYKRDKGQLDAALNSTRISEDEHRKGVLEIQHKWDEARKKAQNTAVAYGLV